MHFHILQVNSVSHNMTSLLVLVLACMCAVLMITIIVMASLTWLPDNMKTKCIQTGITLHPTHTH